MSNIDIVIKSYKVDRKWLRWCFKSIKQFATGYNKIILILPAEEVAEFNLEVPDRTEVHFIIEPEVNKYHFQQYCKLTSYKYSDADYILFFDSDCLLNGLVDISTLVQDEKPTILYTPYSELPGVPWKESTEKVFGHEVEFEYMRRNFLIYHRHTLRCFCEWFEISLKQPLLDYFLEADTISEFNLIGSYAWFKEHENYHWINTTKEPLPPTIGDQIWSWADKDGDEVHQKEYARALETINRIFNLNLTEL